MSELTFLATGRGVVVAEFDGQTWHVIRRSLTGYRVTCIIARDGVVLAGASKGIFRSEDLGRNWQPINEGLTIPYVRSLASHPDIPEFESAGTEPAAIFISRDGGQTWQERPEVARLRDEHGWYLPYSLAAGCVRGFAFHGSRIYIRCRGAGRAAALR